MKKVEYYLREDGTKESYEETSMTWDVIKTVLDMGITLTWLYYTYHIYYGNLIWK